MARHPDVILADFEAAVRGTADIDPYEILHEIIGDVQSSYRLAMTDVVDPERVDEVQNTVTDYVANHYGDDGLLDECNTCGGTGRWESTLEHLPGVLVDLGSCPDCDGSA